ncbi:glycosyltransferase [Pedobacter ghigonis]|uniref:glycosyltransferase n=1 Tax=Pedobacter ghigonis TaxID=2730403 RepID=UPI00158F0D1C|nr:glycosyltransferase [Pedobacter ghigonis]
MKNSLLLLMTPNISLEIWNNQGQLSRELDYYERLCLKLNLKLIIYSYGRNDKQYVAKYDGFKVLEMPSWIPKNIPFTCQNLIYNLISLIIYRSDFKKVILSKTNQFPASWMGLWLKFFFNIPLIIRMGYYIAHFKELPWLTKIKERIAFHLCNLILTTSSEACSYIINNYNITPKKILCMSNNINLGVFKPMPLPKTYDLIFVGRLDKVKNIEAIVQIVKKSNLKTLIIGNGALRNYVEEATNGGKSIDWKERVENIDLPRYYNQAKCAIILSVFEGNPKALLEAMSCGIPSIGANAPGIRECITHNINGLMVEAPNQENLDTIGHEISNLLQDDAKIEMLGKNALKWSKANFDIAKNIITEVNFYSRFLSANI